MSTSYCNAARGQSDSYIGARERPQVFPELCVDPEFETMRSSQQVGTETRLIPSDEYDNVYGIDTRSAPRLSQFGSGFDAQMQFATDLLPSAEDVMGVLLKQGEGILTVTSNRKDLPFTGIQSLREYIPAPMDLSMFGQMNLATTGVMANAKLSGGTGSFPRPVTMQFDPRYELPSLADVDTNVYGVPLVNSAESIGMMGEPARGAQNAVYGAPGFNAELTGL